jgi:hypothetical protein
MAKTILRNDQLASIFYGANNPGQPMTMIPKVRYMYYANFILNPVAPTMDPQFLTTTALGSTSPGNISFKIKTIDKPKIDLTTVEMNQYNRKRLIYTKIEYLPFTVKLHNAVDGSAVQFWRDYFIYYFGDSRPKQQSDLDSIASGPAAPIFNDSTGWGLRPISEYTDFFLRVDLYSLYGGGDGRYRSANGTGRCQLTSYLNPRITAIDFEQYDSTSSDTEEVSITFKYEAIQYNDVQNYLTKDDLSLFGFSVDGKHLEVSSMTNATVSPTPGKTGAVPSQTLPNTPPPSNESSPIIAPPTPTDPVNNAPIGYATNQTGSTDVSGPLINSQNSTNSAISSNAGQLNYG